jgi:hypothetical protein
MNLTSIYSFQDIWPDYQRFILTNFKPKNLGGVQKLALNPFPEILYNEIWKILFPGKTVSSSFEISGKNIECLNVLFGDGSFNESGWCCRTSCDDERNKSKWWMIHIRFSYSVKTIQLILNISWKRSLNGKELTPENNTK